MFGSSFVGSSLAHAIEELHDTLQQSDMTKEIQEVRSQLAEFAEEVVQRDCELEEMIDALRAENDELGRIMMALIIRVDQLQGRLG